jgi:hypothetical protein
MVLICLVSPWAYFGEGVCIEGKKTTHRRRRRRRVLLAVSESIARAVERREGEEEERRCFPSTLTIEYVAERATARVADPVSSSSSNPP